MPIARDLKEPLGWTFSSLRKMRQPAAREREADSTRGVWIHGVWEIGVVAVSGAMLPILLVALYGEDYVRV